MKRLLFAVAVGAALLTGCSKSASTGAAAVPLPAFTPWPNITPENARKLSDSRLKRLSLALITCAQKHGDTFPDTSSPEAFRAAVYPFLEGGGADLFVHPVTGEAFAVNPSLSKQKTADVPETSAMLYEANADGNLTRGVVFALGNFKRVDEADWPQIKAASKIP